MPYKVSQHSMHGSAVEWAGRAFQVLVVDPDAQMSRSLKRWSTLTAPMQVHRAKSLAEARRRMNDGGLIDLVVVEQDLPDGSGLELAREIRQRHRRTRTVVAAAAPTLNGAVSAIRAGAIDFLTKPIDRDQLRACVERGMQQRRMEKQQSLRARRLRRACRKIDAARADIAQQVDVLCHDLVTAYQELACQMEHAVSVREFEALVSDELDLEPLLRKTLEYLVDRLGPTNAVMFLPCATDEYSLGGHINYDCEVSNAEMLVQDLAEQAAPRFADADHVVHLSTEAAKRQWLGDSADYFAEHDVLGFSSVHEGEALAVMILFRDNAQPFDEPAREICAGVAQVLAEALVRLLRVHHRCITDPNADLDIDTDLA